MRTVHRRRSSAPRVFTAGLLVLASALAGCGPGVMPPSVGHPLAGAPAPEFHELSTSSRTVGIPGRTRTKVTVVDFWASWCQACQSSIPLLDSLFRDHQTDGLMVIGINVGEPDEQVLAGAQALGASFPIVADRAQRLCRQFGVAQIPLTFVVDRGGIVRWVGSSAQDARTAAMFVLAE